MEMECQTQLFPVKYDLDTKIDILRKSEVREHYFPHLSRSARRLAQSSIQWVPGFSRGKAARAWRLPPTSFLCRD